MHIYLYVCMCIYIYIYTYERTHALASWTLLAGLPKEQRTKVKCIEALQPCFEKGGLVLSALQQPGPKRRGCAVEIRIVPKVEKEQTDRSRAF